jgi:hypothetical protein
MITVLAVLAIAILTVLALALTRPDELRVQRSVVIDAPAERIHPHINDFALWRAWSPYEVKDPAMQRTLSGAASGLGAVYEWSGNKQVGSGRMEITGAATPSMVTIKLDFFTPFEGHNTAEFSLRPSGTGTEVTWVMFGPAVFMSKLMGLFFNMDKMIGNDFAKGLENLKAVVEKG